MRPLSPLSPCPLEANKTYQGRNKTNWNWCNQIRIFFVQSRKKCSFFHLEYLHKQDIELWIVISADNCWLIATGIIMDNNVQNWIIIWSWGANICHDCHTSLTLTQHIPVQRWTCAKICRLIETLYLFMQFSRCLNIHWCITFLRD